MQDIFRSQFRLPNDLADKLREEAERNNRSLNAEIVARLEGSFQTAPSNQAIDVNRLASEIARQLDPKGLFITAGAQSTLRQQEEVERGSDDRVLPGGAKNMKDVAR